MDIREIAGMKFLITEFMPDTEIHALRGVRVTEDLRIEIETRPIIVNLKPPESCGRGK